jgi:GTP-binding protein
MIIKAAEFVKSAVNPSHYPVHDLPEIAFAGRSNAGKSSLINTLLNRKNLVKTGATPGRTQLVNFFMINSLFFFVDLPGYGYAKVPAHIKKTWGPMIEKYLSTRENIKGVLVLMDIRRNPAREELDFIGWLSYYGIPFVFVLTKADKFSKNKRSNRHRIISEKISLREEDIILFSAKSRQGKKELWEAIENLMNL